MIIKKDPDIIRSYLEDSSNVKGGHADEVAIPENIDELAGFIKDANLKKIPLTISGGGTNTTGSRIPFGGKVLSLEKFNKILEITTGRVCAVVQAGVLVEDLQASCEKAGLFYTSHPTEKTASIGGTVATNASGSRSFKYGPTRKFVRRLKMVLASGEILEIIRGERMITKANPRLNLSGGLVIELPIPGYKIPEVKNSAGYFAKDGMDLIDLFIGQEGTLSVITEIEIGLVKKPAKILSAFAFFKDEADAWRFADDARTGLRSALSIEYFDRNSLELLRSAYPNLPEGSKAAIFFEEEATARNEDSLLGECLGMVSRNNGSPDSTWMAMNDDEVRRFTEFRHHIPEAINDIVRSGAFPKISTDIAVPPNRFNEMLRFYSKSFQDDPIAHVIFGHIGECHLHVNLLPESDKELARAKAMCRAFIEKGVSLGGTISAEHGVGKTKYEYLEMMYGRSGVLDMARMKKAFDPNCILGLDNIFPRKILDLI